MWPDKGKIDVRYVYHVRSPSFGTSCAASHITLAYTSSAQIVSKIATTVVYMSVISSLTNATTKMLLELVNHLSAQYAHVVSVRLITDFACRGDA